MNLDDISIESLQRNRDIESALENAEKSGGSVIDTTIHPSLHAKQRYITGEILFKYLTDLYTGYRVPIESLLYEFNIPSSRDCTIVLEIPQSMGIHNAVSYGGELIPWTLELPNEEMAYYFPEILITPDILAVYEHFGISPDLIQERVSFLNQIRGQGINQSRTLAQTFQYFYNQLKYQLIGFSTPGTIRQSPMQETNFSLNLFKTISNQDVPSLLETLFSNGRKGPYPMIASGFVHHEGVAKQTFLRYVVKDRRLVYGYANLRNGREKGKKTDVNWKWVMQKVTTNPSELSLVSDLRLYAYMCQGHIHFGGEYGMREELLSLTNLNPNTSGVQLVPERKDGGKFLGIFINEEHVYPDLTELFIIYGGDNDTVKEGVKMYLRNQKPLLLVNHLI